MHRTSHAILFVTPTDADTRAVNVATGSHGFGHVALWGGDIAGGQPIVLDSSMTRKCVSFRPMREMTEGKPYEALYLDDALGGMIFRRALRCIAAPYHFRGLFSSEIRDDAFTCSGLVACALPAHLGERCRQVAATLPFKAVSPNAIAIALGVPKWSPKP
jgi:hypothetical protein